MAEGCEIVLNSNNRTGFCRPHAIPARRAQYGKDVQATRRARELGHFVERVYRSVVWTRDGGICHICELPADVAKWHLDHIVPLSKGGEHSYANTAVSHPRCNQVKSAKLAA